MMVEIRKKILKILRTVRAILPLPKPSRFSHPRRRRRTRRTRDQARHAHRAVESASLLRRPTAGVFAARRENHPEANFAARIVQRQSAATAAANAERSITLPAIVNGQIMPGGVDRFRFQPRAKASSWSWRPARAN